MKSMLAVITLGLLVGCTTVQTDVQYGPLGTNGGYSEMRRSFDTWAVRYTGNAHTTGTTVRDMTLLRSAEVTLKSSYTWFVISESLNESGHDLVDTTVSGVQGAQISSGQSGSSTKQTNERQMLNTKFISQYRYEIKCYRDDPGDPEALDATIVETEIRAKYGLSE